MENQITTLYSNHVKQSPLYCKHRITRHQHMEGLSKYAEDVFFFRLKNPLNIYISFVFSGWPHVRVKLYYSWQCWLSYWRVSKSNQTSTLYKIFGLLVLNVNVWPLLSPFLWVWFLHCVFILSYILLRLVCAADVYYFAW